MDEINKMRKQYLIKGESIHRISQEFKRSWNTVRDLVQKSPQELAHRGKRPNRKASVLTAEVVGRVTELLEQEEKLKVRKKQRYTAKWIDKELKRQGQYQGAYSTMKRLVRRLRGELGQSQGTAYLPLSFQPGETLQIDPGVMECVIADERVEGSLFVASLPGIPIRYCQAYPVKSQEAWGQFHESSFSFYGGVFSRMMYDNDSVLVSKVLGRDRNQTQFSHELEQHYGFESVFCNVASGHEKGSVENAVGYCRRNYLAGLPKFESWQKMNEFLQRCCVQEMEQGSHYRTGHLLSDLLIQVKSGLKDFVRGREWVRWKSAKVNSYQLVHEGNHRYSVPERYVGSYVTMGIGVNQVKVEHQGQWIAEHDRVYGVYGDSLKLDHYLDQLGRKPAALRYCQATQAICKQLKTLLDRLNHRLGYMHANEEFIQILMLGRRYSQPELEKAISLSLDYGALSASAVETLLRSMNAQQGSPFTEEDWLTQKLPHLKPLAFQPEFDLSGYAQLGQEVAYAH